MKNALNVFVSTSFVQDCRNLLLSKKYLVHFTNYKDGNPLEHNSDYNEHVLRVLKSFLREHHQKVKDLTKKLLSSWKV